MATGGERNGEEGSRNGKGVSRKVEEAERRKLTDWKRIA
jgi:hypothetical protein